MPSLLDLLHVRDNLRDVARIVVVRNRPIHARAVVVHADHRDFKPLVAGHLAQRRQSVDRRATCSDDLLRLRFEHPVLPARRLCDPVAGVLPVKQHDVEVFGLRNAAHLVKTLLRIDARIRRDLVHKLVAVARVRLECLAEHRRRHVRLPRSQRSGCRGRKHTQSAAKTPSAPARPARVHCCCQYQTRAASPSFPNSQASQCPSRCGRKHAAAGCQRWRQRLLQSWSSENRADSMGSSEPPDLGSCACSH